MQQTAANRRHLVALEEARARVAGGEPLVGELARQFRSAVHALDPTANEDTLGLLSGVGQTSLYPAMLLQAKLREGERVLDLGCGVGVLTRWVATITGAAGRAIGVDPNVDALAAARARTGDRFSASFQVGRAEDLGGIADGSIDCVLACLVLDEVDDLAMALGEIARVLRPGGRLVTASMCFDEVGPADLGLWGDCMAVVARHAPGALAGRASRASFPDEAEDWVCFSRVGLQSPEYRPLGLVAQLPNVDAAWGLFSRSYVGYLLDASGAEELRSILARHVPCTFTIPLRILRSGRPGGVAPK